MQAKSEIKQGHKGQDINVVFDLIADDPTRRRLLLFFEAGCPPTQDRRSVAILLYFMPFLSSMEIPVNPYRLFAALLGFWVNKMTGRK